MPRSSLDRCQRVYSARTGSTSLTSANASIERAANSDRCSEIARASLTRLFARTKGVDFEPQPQLESLETRCFLPDLRWRAHAATSTIIIVRTKTSARSFWCQLSGAALRSHARLYEVPLFNVRIEADVTPLRTRSHPVISSITMSLARLLVLPATRERSRSVPPWPKANSRSCSGRGSRRRRQRARAHCAGSSPAPCRERNPE